MSTIRPVAGLVGVGFLAAFLGGVGLVASAQTATRQTRADAEKDPVLKAMLEELDRSKSKLQLKDFSKPFFIQYRIEEVEDYTTKAEFGASEGGHRTHQRAARITVRVGDAVTDSSGGRGDGAIELASLEDDPIALRSTLWVGTDQAYKSALSAFAQKQAELKEVQTPPQADDFSKEKPLISLAEPVKLKLDEQAWTDRVARDSGLYRSDATVKTNQHEVEYSSAEFHAHVVTTWLVNSEGTIVRKSAAAYEEGFAVGTQAADGMRLDRSYSTSGTTLTDLDSAEAFDKHAVAEIASLSDLRKAPLVEEEYHGLVLLSADAGTDIMRALLSGSVTATRPKLGTEARTSGAFATSFHTRVAPDFLDVVDDPTLKSYAGKGLLGAYDVDDEGVAAQAVKLIIAGKLENYLIGRQPVRDFPQSNGHGRAGLTGAPSSSIGVLKITGKDGLTDEELNKKLLDLAKDRGQSSAYYIETLGGEETPRLLYRVGLDGKRQLVRGATLKDLDRRTLRSSVEAVGKDLYVGNYFADIPETVLAPALLVDDVTIKRANEKNDKLPYYPAPE